MVCNGKQNNSVEFGVLWFFGCSGVPVFRGVPVFLVLVHAPQAFEDLLKSPLNVDFLKRTFF